MRALAFLVLSALTFAAGSAAAEVVTQPNCVTVGAGTSPGYNTVCALTDLGWSYTWEGYEHSYSETRLLTTSEAHRLNTPAGEVVETWGFDTLAQSEGRYYESWGTGSSDYQTDHFEASSVRAIILADRAAVGYHAGLYQDGSSYESCYDGECSAYLSQMTTVGASAYVATRAGPGLGVGSYYYQNSAGENTCTESANLQLSGGDLFYEYVPLVGDQPCVQPVPWMNENVAFPDGPDVLPSLEA